MEPLLKRLKNREIIISDGAIGSMILSRGLPAAACPESYNLTHKEVLKSIAGEYLKAGAEIVQTNTFGGSPLKLIDYSLDDKTEEININAVEVVREAVSDKAYVSGSCGPSGKILKPYGDTTVEEMHDSFSRQMTALTGAGVDLICIETMTDINEASIAIRCAKEISPDIPVMATMTFDPTPRGFFTIMGTDIPAAAKLLKDAGADIIGSNCGNGIENMVKIAEKFKEETDQPVIIQSNAGLPELKNGKIFYSETPEFMAEKAAELAELDVAIIGGCCGTTPDHIRAIRYRIDSLN
ncbi:MAG: homocysteine S-methyltransferase family protein [Acidobacteriota bacterium]